MRERNVALVDRLHLFFSVAHRQRTPETILKRTLRIFDRWSPRAIGSPLSGFAVRIGGAVSNGEVRLSARAIEEARGLFFKKMIAAYDFGRQFVKVC